MSNYDYSKLRGRIVEKYRTISAFSNAVKIDPGNLSLKLNNRVRFNQDDILKISESLDIQKSDMYDYFLTKMY